MVDDLVHFTDTQSCTLEQLGRILARGERLIAEPALFDGRLSGGLLINLFYEPSTRTRVSFETAAKRLGMHVINVSAHGSSVEKGETLADTFYTLQAMQPNCIVVRHPDEGNADRLAELAEPGVHVINAGDGVAAHPTQALLDALTLRHCFGDLSGLTIALAGDIRHSRVARSAVLLLGRLGVPSLRLCGPDTFMPDEDELSAWGPGVSVFDRIDDALHGADAIMMLRIQRERIQGLQIPDADDYFREWGLTAERLARAGAGCRVLHPGPMNRGVEIAPEVADGPQSLIRAQVRNGLHARMSLILELVSGDDLRT
jgi:aspartate carbamoyltransferase catalytic subunit